MKLTFASVCSGIEAASAAWLGLGWQCAFVSEIEAFPSEVFVIGHLGGDWQRAAAVLFERESLCGDSAPRRQTGQGTAPGPAAGAGTSGELAPTISARTNGGGGLGTDFDCDGGLISTAMGEGFEVSRPLLGKPNSSHEESQETYIAEPIAFSAKDHGADAGGLSPTLRAGNSDGSHANSGNWIGVAHALRAEGFDASEDGTGRGTPLVTEPLAIQEDNQNGILLSRTGGSLRANAPGSQPGGSLAIVPIGIPETCCTILAGGNKTGGDRPMGMDADTAESLIPEVLAHGQAGAEHVRDGEPSLTCNHEAPILFSPQIPEIVGTLSDGAHNGGGLNGQDAYTGRIIPTEESGLKMQVKNSDRTSSAMAVRRLTPRECERLQGFPDDYTLIARNGKPASACPDGPRYKALGNSMCVNVMKWIGQRIELVEKIKIL